MKRSVRAVMNPKSVGNLRAVEKEIRRLQRMPNKEERDTALEAIARLERFKSWYLATIKGERGAVPASERGGERHLSQQVVHGSREGASAIRGRVHSLVGDQEYRESVREQVIGCDSGECSVP